MHKTRPNGIHRQNDMQASHAAAPPLRSNKDFAVKALLYSGPGKSALEDRRMPSEIALGKRQDARGI